jgi:hypothetical protein
MTRGDERDSAGGRENSFGRRLRVGAAGSIVIGGAIFLGGAASLVTAFANTGEVQASQSCTTWSVNAGLDNNVAHRLVIVSWPNASTLVINKEYTTNSPPLAVHSIFSANGAAPKSGTITETIYNGTTIASGVDGTPKSATLVAPSDCTSAISTTPSAGGVVGTAIHDSATVTGTLGSPAGSVVFALFPPSNATCSANGAAAVLTSSAISLTSVTPGTSNASSPSFTTDAVGVYHWVAAYTPAGGSPYKASTSKCSDEAVTTTQGGPTVSTTTVGSGQVPVSLSDSATVSGGVSPTGTVTFNLFSSNTACLAAVGTSTGAVYTSPAEALSGGKATSGSFNATSAGTYEWIAKYSGDANNASAKSTCGNEPVTTTTGGGGVQAISITTPGTGSTGSLTGITVGGFLLLGGLGFALMGVLVPRRRNSQ